MPLEISKIQFDEVSRMNEECLICKAPLEYRDSDIIMECELCHKKQSSKTRCINGHFVCDECHTSGMDEVLSICFNSKSKNPIELLEEMMCIPSRSHLNNQCLQKECPFHTKAKKKVVFICVHNSCRSQIAEALGNHLAADVFESYSAGTETKAKINQDAVRLMKELYGIDMEQTQYSKLITDIPDPDIAISMGCNVGCPFIGRAFDDNWELEDPTGKSDDEFKITINEIENRIMQLKNELI